MSGNGQSLVYTSRLIIVLTMIAMNHGIICSFIALYSVSDDAVMMFTDFPSSPMSRCLQKALGTLQTQDQRSRLSTSFLLTPKNFRNLDHFVHTTMNSALVCVLSLATIANANAVLPRDKGCGFGMKSYSADQYPNGASHDYGALDSATFWINSASGSLMDDL